VVTGFSGLPAGGKTGQQWLTAGALSGFEAIALAAFKMLDANC
jgi:hypothetical protein